jgi:hypothetical protein
MATAFRAHPELIRRPRHARARVAHVHLRAAALTPDMAINFSHSPILALQNLYLPTCNLQPATCNLQPATCNLQSAIWNLESGICNLQSAICNRIIVV